MTDGPYTTRGLWLYDGKGNRLALCYTLPIAAALLEELNAPKAPPASYVGAAGECLFCRAEQGEMHETNCPNR